jgi:hypothetical protein
MKINADVGVKRQKQFGSLGDLARKKYDAYADVTRTRKLI